jgi:hypothetical protein
VCEDEKKMFIYFEVKEEATFNHTRFAHFHLIKIFHESRSTKHGMLLIHIMEGYLT